MQLLDKIMLYASYPMMFLSGVWCTLLGFGLIPHTVEKSEEVAQEKRLRLLRWIGPILIIGIIGMWVAVFFGVF